MFTSLKLLRSSDASPARVNTVFEYLKKTYRTDWPLDAIFPAEVVFVSNGVDDYNWVIAEPIVRATQLAYHIDPNTFPDGDPGGKEDAQDHLDALEAMAADKGLSIFNPMSNMLKAGSLLSSPTSEAKTPVPAIAKTAKAAKPIIVPESPENIGASADIGIIRGFVKKQRTRAKLEETLRTFIDNAMVTTLVPILKEQATSIDIEVPKGKQAFVIVL